MNQFKVGDTVWTVKKGKGVIREINTVPETARPFVVRFGFAKWHRPKLSNLYRTKAEMIEAKKARWNVSEFKTHSPRVATNKETAGWREMLEGKRPIKIHVSLIDTPQPKFKKGDKVYYEGNKWDVGAVSNNSCIIVHNSGISHIIPESELRLWKEHEFTHWLVSWNNVLQKSETSMTPKDYTNVNYLGRLHNSIDTFSAINQQTGALSIFFGKKGDLEI